MDTEHRDTVWHVFRICALWGAVAGSYNILQICVPLITRDIDADAAPTWLGRFMSVNAISGSIFSVFGGFFSDFVGRMTLMRPWAVFYFLCVLSVLLADQFKNVYFILFARTSAIAVPTTILLAYFSDFLRDAALVESYGYLSGSFAVCNCVFTLLCGVVNELFSRKASLLLAVIVASVVLLLSLLSPAPRAVQEAMERRNEESRLRGKKHNVSKEELFRSLRVIVADRYLLLVCIACSAVRLANMNDYLMMVYFIAYRTDAGLSAVSYVLAVMALTMAVGQLVLLPLTVRRRCVYPVLVFSLVGMMVCVVGFALCFRLSHFIVTASALGCCLMVPSIYNARISALSSLTGTSGITLGLVSTITNTVEIVVAVLFGQVLSWATQTFDKTSLWSGIPMLLNGAIIGVALIVTLYAETRYGRGFAPWGIENKRAAEQDVDTAPLVGSLSDGSQTEAAVMMFGSKDVEPFAASSPYRRPPSPTVPSFAVVVERSRQ